MKTIFWVASAALAMLAPAVNAQSVSFGGDINAVYISRDGGSGGDDRYQGNGSLVAGFGNVGVQLDLGAQSYADGDGFDNFAYGAHVFYAINPALTIGAYYSVTDFGGLGNTADHYGVEAKFTPGGANGRIELEAFAGMYEVRGNDYGANLIGLSGSYAVTDNIDLFGGYLWGDWGNTGNRIYSYDVLTAGAAYTFDSGFYIAAAYQSYNYVFATDDHTVIVQIGYQFGGGKVFGGRSYYDLYPGD